MSLTKEQGAGLTPRRWPRLFLAVALVFVYRSFYGMRIEAPEAEVAGGAAVALKV